MKNFYLVFTVSVILLFAGCANTEKGRNESLNMTNPASVYCEQNGGTLDIRTDAGGGQYGVCVFPDGRQCEEWAYYRSNGTNCTNMMPANPEIRCSVDSDCGCGKKLGTGECFIGNKDYVDTEKQCPDFCSGISGKLRIRCEQNRCVQRNSEVNSFDECAAAGYPVMESYPRQCRTPEGKSFTENISGNANMPNPASVYCIEKGGKLEIRTDSSGGQYGVCILPDGRECEEWDYFRSNGTTCTNESPRLIGGDTDEHGCLIAAGYSWNESVKACVREWELNENQKKAAKIAVEYLNPLKGVTIKGVDVMRCPGCFRVNLILNLNSGDKEVSVTLENWYVKEEVSGEKHVCTNEEKAAEVCTLEYAPVCGDDGVTYGNKCMACASKKINEYTSGECPDDKPTNPTSGKLKANDCTDPRTAACTKEYVPVCGWFSTSIQCIKYPCADNYANKCTACADATVAYWTEGECPETSDGSEGSGSSGMANPAATYCIEQGGNSEIKTAADGSQYGTCLINGRECEEWAYFRSNGSECTR